MAGDLEQVTLDQVARRLIEDNFLLTALELHLELIEAGREMTRLKEFFSNPANFERQSAPHQLISSIARSHSQATLDSLDISRLSEDGADERVAVLEFELRKAKETISGLRTTLTQMTAEREENVTNESAASNETVRPHEKRALNFLVNEFLLRQGYKLTAVTFSEENNDQDFDDWDDVGLNIPRPPELPQLYRVIHKETSDAVCQTEESMCSEEDYIRLKNNYEELEQLMEEERSNFLAKVPVPPEKPVVEFVSVATNTSEIIIKESQEHLDFDHSKMSEPNIGQAESEEVRALPKKFQNLLYELVDTPMTPPATANQGISDLLLENVPAVAAARKEAAVPIIVAAAEACGPDRALPLVTLLLNLRKRPQESERRAVVEGVRRLWASSHGLEMLERLVLPQAWELAGQKAVERRRLAAEICLAVAPFVPGRLRHALVLPMLQQLLLEAAEPDVRVASVHAMAIVIAHTASIDKYLQCEELCFAALEDQHPTVRLQAQQTLLPVLAQWALQAERLESYLVKRFLTRLRSLAHDPRCGAMVEALGHLLPFVLVHLASHPSVVKRIDSENEVEIQLPTSGLNNPQSFFDADGHSTNEVMGALRHRLEDDSYQGWAQVEWMLSSFLPGLYEAVGAVEVANEEAVLAYLKFYHQLCKTLGHHFTVNRIKPAFKEGLRGVEDMYANQLDEAPTQPLLSLAVIPVLLVAILTTGDPHDTLELSSTLRHLLILLPSLKLPLLPLKVSTFHLCRAAALQEPVLLCLTEACKNARPVVRLAAAQLILHCLSCIHDAALTKIILPQMAMLATDMNEEVKEVVVAIYAELSAEQGVAQVESRAALQSLLREATGSHVMSVAVTKALARILPTADPVYAEDVVLPQLCQLSAFCLHGVTSQTRRMDLGQTLVGTVSVAMQVPLSRQAMAATLIPALRDLSVVCEQCMHAHYDGVSNWLREIEARTHIESNLPTTPKTDKPHLVQAAMSSASAVGRRSVEDVKQKMSSLLRKK